MSFTMFNCKLLHFIISRCTHSREGFPYLPTDWILNRAVVIKNEVVRLNLAIWESDQVVNDISRLFHTKWLKSSQVETWLTWPVAVALLNGWRYCDTNLSQKYFVLNRIRHISCNLQVIASFVQITFPSQRNNMHTFHKHCKIFEITQWYLT